MGRAWPSLGVECVFLPQVSSSACSKCQRNAVTKGYRLLRYEEVCLYCPRTIHIIFITWPPCSHYLLLKYRCRQCQVGLSAHPLLHEDFYFADQEPSQVSRQGVTTALLTRVDPIKHCQPSSKAVRFSSSIQICLGHLSLTFIVSFLQGGRTCWIQRIHVNLSRFTPSRDCSCHRIGLPLMYRVEPSSSWLRLQTFGFLTRSCSKSSLFHSCNYQRVPFSSLWMPLPGDFLVHTSYFWRAVRQSTYSP